MKPRITFLSPGPGDPDLLPVKAARRLREAKTVFRPKSTGREVITRHAEEDVSVRELSSEGEDAVSPLLEAAQAQGRIVRLTAGEGLLTSAVLLEIDRLAAHPVELEILPGLERARGAALFAGMPLASSERVQVVQADVLMREDTPLEGSKWTDNQTFLIPYEDLGTLRSVARRLIETGHSPDRPLGLVERPTRNDQTTRLVALGELGEGSTERELPPRGIGVVGRALRERSEPRWLLDRPLHGTRIIVTRPRNGPGRLTRRLRRAGARVLHYPSIRIRPLEEGLKQLREECRKLGSYDWIVFTSRNGVRFFLRALNQSGVDVRALHGVRIACIGRGTARALREVQLRADLIPETYRAESLASSLLDQTGEDDRILLARAGGARDVLPRRLERRNRAVREIPLYVAEPAREYRDDLRRALSQGQADMITFTSSSTVDNLFDLLGDPEQTRRRLNRVHCGTIGPITAETLRDRGVEVQVIPDQYDFQHLTQAIADYYRDTDRRGQSTEVPSR